MPFFRAIRAALVFLTRIPFGGYPYSATEWAWAPAHFPLVGVLVGGLAGLVQFALFPAGSWVAAVLSVSFAVLITGAFHEDGLADTADGLGGGYTRDKVLEILKDSRIGTFGATALGLALLARVALQQELGWATLWVLPMVGGLARVGPVWLMVLLPHASPEGSKSRDLAGTGWGAVVVATLWGGLLLGLPLYFGWLGVVRASCIAGTLVLTSGYMAWRGLRRIGGITGDLLGAAEQLGEIGVLVVFAWGTN